MKPRPFYARYEEWEFIRDTIERELARVIFTGDEDIVREAIEMSSDYAMALAVLGLEEEE